MYFVPEGILVKGDEAWAAGANLPEGAGDLTWGAFVLDNLLPVTIGNLIGGTLMVGAVYWFVYLRDRASR
jgi:formate/nitrite transporter FocA (FNT family)